MTQTQRTLANVCLFCGEKLSSPSMCRFCGFKFCEEHKSTENHQCIKTRYSEYIRQSDPRKTPNIATGKFRVICEMCGFSTSKGASIEYAGEELIQHMQIVGCNDKIFLEEIDNGIVPTSNTRVAQSESLPTKPDTENSFSNSSVEQQTSVVDQILKLSSLKEKGMISNEEFEYIKKELIKKLK